MGGGGWWWWGWGGVQEEDMVRVKHGACWSLPPTATPSCFERKGFSGDRVFIEREYYVECWGGGGMGVGLKDACGIPSFCQLF